MEVHIVSPELKSEKCSNRNVCTCTCKHIEYTVKFVKLGLCISLLLTLVSVSACVIALRSSMFAREQWQLMQRDLQHRPTEQNDEGRPVQGTVLQFLHAEESSPNVHQSAEGMSRDRRSSDKSKKSRKGKKKGKKGFCRKVSRCPSAADVTKRELIASEFQVDGSTVYGQNIGKFQLAQWAKANVKQAARASGSELIVTESGVYLVYSSVLFNDTKYREGLVVQKNDLELLKCFDGVDNIDTSKTRVQNFKFKTCSVSGVTYLSEGDTLRMLNLYDDTNLDTSPGSTFIGLIQLIPALHGIK